MSAETYNGWANYPTWAVNLWLSNDEGLDSLVREQASELLATSREHDHTIITYSNNPEERYSLLAAATELAQLVLADHCDYLTTVLR